MSQLYCDVPDCCDPENPGFPRAAFRDGKCSTHKKQLQRTGRTTEIAEKLNAEERAIKSGTAMLEADSQSDYDRHRRAWLLACRELGDQERVGALKKSMAQARARGVRIGRPPKVETKRVLELVRLLGRASLAAQVLGVHRDTIYAHLARSREKKRFPTRLAG